MASPAPVLTVIQVLQQKFFCRLWLSQCVRIFGDSLGLFGVISLITYRFHGTAFQVTVVLLAYVLPMAVVAPPAGVFVDRWNVKRLMIVTELIRVVLVLLLLFVTDLRQICAIFATLAILSCFFNPAQSVAVRILVPKESLLAANSLMAQAFYTIGLLSPVIAGALVVWFTEKSCFYIDACGFLISSGILFTLSIVRPKPERTKTLLTFTRDYLAGNKFIFSHRGLVFVFTAMLVGTFILSSLRPLFSIYVRDSLSAGSFIFGVLGSMAGLGVVLGTYFVNRVARHISKFLLVVGGLVGLALGTALLGIFSNVPMAALSTFLIGFAIAFIIVPSQTLSQQETAYEMMGRVSASLLSLLAFAQVFGLLLSGYIAQVFGIRKLLMSCAAVLALLSAGGYALIRERSEPVNTPDSS